MSQTGAVRRPPPRTAAASRTRPPRAAATTTTVTATTTTTTRKKSTTSQMSVADRRKAAGEREAERRQQELRERGIDPEKVKAKTGTFLKRGQGRRVVQRSSAEKAEDLRRKEEARAIRLREKGPALLKGAVSRAKGRSPAQVVEQVEESRQSRVTVTRKPPRRAAAAAAASPQTPVQAQQIRVEMPIEVVVSPPRISQEQPPAEPSPEQAMARAITPPPPAAPPEVVETLENILAQHEYVEKIITLRHVVRQQRFRRRFMTSALTPVEAVNQDEEEREIAKEVRRLMAAQSLGQEIVIPPLEEGPLPAPAPPAPRALPPLSPRFEAMLEGEGLLEVEAPSGIRERTPSPRAYQLPQPPPELEQIMGMLWQCKQILKREEFAFLVQRILARDFKIDSDLESIPSSEYDSEGELNVYAEPGVRQLLEVSPSLAPGRFSTGGRGPAARALGRLLNY